MAKNKTRKTKNGAWGVPASRWKPLPEVVDDEPGIYAIVNSIGLPGALSTGMTDKVKRVVFCSGLRRISCSPKALPKLANKGSEESVLLTPSWRYLRVCRRA